MRLLQDNLDVEARYERLLDASPHGSVYQTIDWLRVFKTLGGELVFIEVDSETLIPFVCKGKGRFRRAFSLPYDTYGGPVTPERKSVVPYDEVMHTLDMPSARLVDYTADVVPSNCRVETVRTHLVELDRGYDAIFGGYSKMNQRAIKQAFKRGLRIAVVRDRRHVRAFYRLYRRTVTRYRTPPLPRRFFEAIFDLMVPKGLARFYLAWHGNRPVGGNLVLRYKNQAYDWSWGYDRNHLHLRPTNALIDRAIQDQRDEGTDVFNLGTSPPGSNGNAQFKENFGAKDYEYQILSKVGFAYQTARMVKKGLRFPTPVR